MAITGSITTLTELIQAGTTAPYNINDLAKLETVGNITRISYTYFDKYRDVILDNAVDVKLSDSEMKYLNNPALLSKALYDTPLLKGLLLFLNRCPIQQFDKPIIKILPTDVVNNLIQEIIIYEKKVNLRKEGGL